MISRNFLHVLVDPKDAQLDVVAVHGLNYTNREKHAEKTWTASNEKMWLKDFLPKQLPDARILLFGYNTNVAFSTSAAGVDEQAENLLNRLWLSRSKIAMGRPIMFICYQLGGIIVKRALFGAQLDRTYESIRKSCYGLVFFATPHKGGKFETLKELADSSLNNTFIETLKERSQFADGIARAFRHQLEEVLVVSFYETIPMGYSGVVIVDRDSATFGLAGERERQISLDADHENLCIFSDENGNDYDIVGGNIQELSRSIKMLIKKDEEEVNTTSDLDEEERQNVLNWLYPGAFDKKHIEISGRRKKNTGEWILEEPSFQKWEGEDAEYPLLWGYGIAGAGKTFISSFVIDHLQSQASNGVAYIYFDYNEQRQQGPIDVLRSLVKQLTSQLPQLPSKIGDLYKKLRHESRTPTVDDMYTALVMVSKSFAKTFIVCDALDECELKIQRKQLLQLFRKIEDSKTGIKLFLTSREYCSDIQCSFEGSAKIRLYANEKDVQTYIRQKIDEDPQAKQFFSEKDVENIVISQLLDCTNGIFLLVHFYIEFLCQQTTRSEMLEELEKLKNATTNEKPLDLTYERAIANIHKQTGNRIKLALNILLWLVNAQRILTVDEVQVAVSIKRNQQKLDALDLPDKKTLLDVCGSLVTLDENSNTIRLTHYTVQEYLQRNSILPEDAGFRLAMACCTYLSFDLFAMSSGFLWDRGSAFLDYAANYFHFHIKGCDESRSKDLVLKFLESPENVNRYLKILLIGSRAPSIRSNGHSYLCASAGFSEYDVYLAGVFGEINISIDMNVPSSLQLPILVSCILGHSLVVRSLLEGFNSIYTTGGNNRIPILGFPRWSAEESDISERKIPPTTLSTLRLAVLLGYKELVKVLLEVGADISAIDQNGETALQNFVCRGDNKEALELLLENGADISTINEDGDTILHRAAYEGRKEVLELLLENGADISAINKNGDTVLHQAAYEGREEVIDLLLKNGANIAATNKNGETVLHKAAYWGYKGVVELLLRRGANILAINGYGDTVLHRAACEGHEGVVKLLHEWGANISIPNKSGDTVLHEAAYGGHEEVVEMLLMWGADSSVVNRNEETVLHKATHEGHEGVIQVLLQAGAEISPVNKNGDTVLHEAALRGYKMVASLLLERGANISAVNKKGDTVLHRAAHEERRGVIELLRGSTDPPVEKKEGDTEAAYIERKELIKLLLEKGVDISVANENGDTALHEFARRGYKEIVELLLRKGADPLAVNKNGNTTLLETAHHGHEGIVELLLDQGADTSVVSTYNGDTIFHKAARLGYERMVELLLRQVADISVVNKNTETMLCEAARYGKERIVELLIERVTVISVVNTYSGDTILHEVIRNGNERIVELLIGRVADTSVINKNGDTILHEAARSGNERIVELLIGRVADTSVVNKNGHTILHEAARHGNERIVELLLRRISDTSVVNKYGDTILQEAIRNGNERIVELLLEQISDTSVVNKNGNTILRQAVRKGNERIVELLLGWISDTSRVNEYGDTILHEAVRKGNERIVELLLGQVANTSVVNKKGDTVLHEAARHGNERLFKLLILRRAADISVVNKNGGTLLDEAVRNGHKTIVEMFLMWDTDTSAFSRNRNSVLHEAVRRGYKKAIELLLDRGASVSALGTDGRTPLIVEISKLQASVEVVRLLLDRGADTTAVDNSGRTALLIEVSKPQTSVEVVRLLLDKGADTTAVDNSGSTALLIEVSKLQGSKEVIQLLLDRGTDTAAVDNSRGTALLIEVSKPQVSEEVVRLLLDKGADTTTVDNSGSTALLIEVSKIQGSKGVIQLLLDRGADTTVVDKSGRTALLIEVSKPQVSEEVVRLLLDKGVDTTAVDNSRSTALLIEVSKPQASEGVIQLLLDRGADITAVDNSGRTALHLAPSIEMIKLLFGSSSIHAPLSLGLFLRVPMYTLKALYHKYMFKILGFVSTPPLDEDLLKLIRLTMLFYHTTSSQNETRAI